MTTTIMAGQAPRLQLADFCPRRAEVPCQFYDPDLWFSEDPDDIARAKEICLTCPFVLECGDYAIANNVVHGTWGALSAENRAAARRGQGRTCPNCRRPVSGLDLYDSDDCRRSALAKTEKLREAAIRRRTGLPGASIALRLAIEPEARAS
jgi:WhiB family transcriptional regulator, redox-sensing transcriptional regulator